MGYNIYRMDTTRQIIMLNIDLIDRNINRFTDKSFPQGQELSYMISALDSVGNESEYSLPFSSYEKPIDNFLEDELAIKIQKNKRTNKLTLRWDYDNPELLGFVIFSGQDETLLKPMSGLMKERTYRIDLAEDINLTYQVRAYIKGGNKIKSSLITKKDYR